jgi:hypothetical protein
MADTNIQPHNQLHRETSGVKDSAFEQVDGPTKYDGELGSDRIALEEYVPGTKEEKRLLRKVDFIMIPSLWFMCVMAYLDRNNIVSFLLHLPGQNLISAREMPTRLE